MSHISGAPFLSLDLFVKSLKFFSCTEEERDAPNACKSDNGVDDTADEGILTAAEPRNYVELEKTDATPVECSDDGEDESDSI